MYTTRPILDVLVAMTGPQYRDFTRAFNTQTVITPDGHILWTGRVNDRGYGIIRIAGQDHRVHRVAWVLAHGRDPDPELVLDHQCRIRTCINPEHLEEVTNAENVLRGTGPAAFNAAKIFCDRGHLLAGDNLRVLPRGERVCRSCHRFRNRRYVARKRATRAFSAAV